jgi:hypothetical protein
MRNRFWSETRSVAVTAFSAMKCTGRSMRSRRYRSSSVRSHGGSARTSGATAESGMAFVTDDGTKGTDEGMTNGPPIFAYLVFGPGKVSLERLSRPIKASKDPKN